MRFFSRLTRGPAHKWLCVGRRLTMRLLWRRKFSSFSFFSTTLCGKLKSPEKWKLAQFRFKDLSGHSVLALVKRNINNRQNQIFCGKKICLRKLDDSRAQHMSSYAAGPTKGSETTAEILYLRSTSIGVGQTF